ncbi:hypothetical protein [Streptomyces beijiangensis]|uniref:Uncharacterized protein n=1 Tax=Streptomyces beijiangensis TaxID=163361 RepID=A0A939JKR8_9ACTN|nr:hypothetical protein [Streptomyces beijiangensis]MBO0515585.1 hypothetical protein [Streptomyces beijiangensis]
MVLAAAVLPAQAADEPGKSVTVGCGKNRTQALHRALVKSAPIGKPVTVYLTKGCRYTYPDKRKQFSVPDGRTIIGHGAVLEGRTDLYPVLTSLTSGSRITLEDVTLTGPSLCVLVPAYSHFTLKNVNLHCSQSMTAMRVKDDGAADLLGDTELRGGGAPTAHGGGGGLIIERGGTVHLRDRAKITNFALSTRMVDVPAGGGETITNQKTGELVTTPYTPARGYQTDGIGAGVLNRGTLTVEDQATITGNKIVRTTQQPKYPLAPDDHHAYKGGGIYN